VSYNNKVEYQNHNKHHPSVKLNQIEMMLVKVIKIIKNNKLIIYKKIKIHPKHPKKINNNMIKKVNPIVDLIKI
jgi:hypothetical protein